MQKLEKMQPSRSSELKAQVISPSACTRQRIARMKIGADSAEEQQALGISALQSTAMW